ncbi:MAG: CHAP domain-containing protein, partial [Lactobacillus sp.]|nr:CHAP domain-containing protein [Lactobacillus sp.]
AWGFGGRGFQQAINDGGGSSAKTEESSGTGVTPQDVITVAGNEIGYLEKNSGNNLESKQADSGDQNWTKFGRDMNKVFGHPTHDAWCATFVVWCVWMACNQDKDMTSKVLYGATTAGCANNESAFKKASRWINGNEAPQAGDIIFYNSSHTGIVTDCDGSKFHTIEGNTGGSNDYNRNGGCVYNKTRSVGDSKIKGFGRPLYDGNSNFKGVAAYTEDGTTVGGGTIGGSSDASSSSGATASSGGFFSKLTSFLTELGSRAIEGVTTGKWNTDWSGFFSGNNSGNSGSTGDTGFSTGDSSGGSSVNNSFGGDVAATAISADESKKKNWQFLTKKMGFTKEAAAGVMGCWEAESHNKPNTIEGYYLKNYPGDSAVLQDNASLNAYTEQVLFPAYANSGISINKDGYKGTDGNYYPGFGLAQWTGPRGQQLFEFAKGKGLDWRTSEGQLAYVENELNGSKSGFRDAIKNVDNVKDATILALDKYEMTEGAHNNATHWNPRYANAQGIYETFKDTNVEESSGGTTNLPTTGNVSNRNPNLAAYGGKGNGKHYGGKGFASLDGSTMQMSMASDIESGAISSKNQNTGDLTAVVKYLNNILNV